MNRQVEGMSESRLTGLHSQSEAYELGRQDERLVQHKLGSGGERDPSGRGTITPTSFGPLEEPLITREQLVELKRAAGSFIAAVNRALGLHPKDGMEKV